VRDRVDFQQREPARSRTEPPPVAGTAVEVEAERDRWFAPVVSSLVLAAVATTLVAAALSLFDPRVRDTAATAAPPPVPPATVAAEPGPPAGPLQVSLGGEGHGDWLVVASRRPAHVEAHRLDNSTEGMVTGHYRRLDGAATLTVATGATDFGAGGVDIAGRTGWVLPISGSLTPVGAVVVADGDTTVTLRLTAHSPLEAASAARAALAARDGPLLERTDDGLAAHLPTGFAGFTVVGEPVFTRHFGTPRHDLWTLAGPGGQAARLAVHPAGTPADQALIVLRTQGAGPSPTAPGRWEAPGTGPFAPPALAWTLDGGALAVLAEVGGAPDLHGLANALVIGPQGPGAPPDPCAAVLDDLAGWPAEPARVAAQHGLPGPVAVPAGTVVATVRCAALPVDAGAPTASLAVTVTGTDGRTWMVRGPDDRDDGRWQRWLAGNHLESLVPTGYGFASHPEPGDQPVDLWGLVAEHVGDPLSG
jgi:hypothetical protein